jgi:hypothetical protein
LFRVHRQQLSNDKAQERAISKSPALEKEQAAPTESDLLRDNTGSRDVADSYVRDNSDAVGMTEWA